MNSEAFKGLSLGSVMNISCCAVELQQNTILGVPPQSNFLLYILKIFNILPSWKMIK